jgi:hypothetical protein
VPLNPDVGGLWLVKPVIPPIPAKLDYSFLNYMKFRFSNIKFSDNLATTSNEGNQRPKYLQNCDEKLDMGKHPFILVTN